MHRNAMASMLHNVQHVIIDPLCSARFPGLLSGRAQKAALYGDVTMSILRVQECRSHAVSLKDL